MTPQNFHCNPTYHCQPRCTHTLPKNCHPSLGYPHPSSFPTHQTYSLPGNICDTIRHVACNKGTGINTNSIDLFSSLLNCSIPTVTNDLQFVFVLIYKNSLPDNIKRYFTDVYLFCLHKDPLNHTKQ